MICRANDSELRIQCFNLEAFSLDGILRDHSPGSVSEIFHGADTDMVKFTITEYKGKVWINISTHQTEDGSAVPPVKPFVGDEYLTGLEARTAVDYIIPELVGGKS